MAWKVWGSKEASIGKTIAISVLQFIHKNCSYSFLIKSPSRIAMCGPILKILKFWVILDQLLTFIPLFLLFMGSFQSFCFSAILPFSKYSYFIVWGSSEVNRGHIKPLEKVVPAPPPSLFALVLPEGNRYSRHWLDSHQSAYLRLHINETAYPKPVRRVSAYANLKKYQLKVI